MQIKKMETSLKRASVNQEEITQAGRYKVMKAEALLEQAQQALMDYALQLHQAEKELAETEIVAPAPGMVVHREDYRSGQRRKPRVGDVLIKNQPFIELPDLNSMSVKTRVREVDLFKVGMGKKATIEVDAYPELILEGTIASLGVLALADLGRSADEKYFEVRIALETCPSCLRPGMTTRATIHAQNAQDVSTVPLQAIFSDHNRNYCYVASAEKGFEKREIQVGISNAQWAEVKTGLQEGECVCLMNPFDENKR
jgi:HlyD family secretion protein